MKHILIVVALGCVLVIVPALILSSVTNRQMHSCQCVADYVPASGLN